MQESKKEVTNCNTDNFSLFIIIVIFFFFLFFTATKEEQQSQKREKYTTGCGGGWDGMGNFIYKVVRLTKNPVDDSSIKNQSKTHASLLDQEKAIYGHNDDCNNCNNYKNNRKIRRNNI